MFAEDSRSLPIQLWPSSPACCHNVALAVGEGFLHLSRGKPNAKCRAGRNDHTARLHVRPFSTLSVRLSLVGVSRVRVLNAADPLSLVEGFADVGMAREGSRARPVTRWRTNWQRPVGVSGLNLMSRAIHRRWMIHASKSTPPDTGNVSVDKPLLQQFTPHEHVKVLDSVRRRFGCDKEQPDRHLLRGSVGIDRHLTDPVQPAPSSTKSLAMSSCSASLNAPTASVGNVGRRHRTCCIR